LKKEKRTIFTLSAEYSNLFTKGSLHFWQIQQLVAEDKQFEIEKIKVNDKKCYLERQKKCFFRF
jgi:hypothetical protein